MDIIKEVYKLSSNEGELIQREFSVNFKTADTNLVAAALGHGHSNLTSEAFIRDNSFDIDEYFTNNEEPCFSRIEALHNRTDALEIVGMLQNKSHIALANHSAGGRDFYLRGIYHQSLCVDLNFDGAWDLFTLDDAEPAEGDMIQCSSARSSSRVVATFKKGIWEVDLSVPAYTEEELIAEISNGNISLEELLTCYEEHGGVAVFAGEYYTTFIGALETIYPNWKYAPINFEEE